MFRAIKRIFIWFGLMAEQATETDAINQAVVERGIAEGQRRSAAEGALCSVCMEAPRSLVFSCGHQTCGGCGDKVAACPFCRQEITAKIRLFNN